MLLGRQGATSAIAATAASAVIPDAVWHFSAPRPPRSDRMVLNQKPRARWRFNPIRSRALSELIADSAFIFKHVQAGVPVGRIDQPILGHVAIGGLGGERDVGPRV